MRLYFLLLSIASATIGIAQNPFASIGKEAEVLTVTNGKYPEFFDNDTLRVFDGAVFNTRTNTIHCFLPPDTVNKIPADVVSRWLSLDPLQSIYPSFSPYNFVGNMPIMAIDPDGQRIKLIGKKATEDFNSIISNFNTYNKDNSLKKSGEDFFALVSSNGTISTKHKLSVSKFKTYASKELGININDSKVTEAVKIYKSLRSRDIYYIAALEKDKNHAGVEIKQLNLKDDPLHHGLRSRNQNPEKGYENPTLDDIKEIISNPEDFGLEGTTNINSNSFIYYPKIDRNKFHSDNADFFSGLIMYNAESSLANTIFDFVDKFISDAHVNSSAELEINFNKNKRGAKDNYNEDSIEINSNPDSN